MNSNGISEAMADAICNLAGIKGQRYADGASAVAAIYMILAENDLLQDSRAVLAARTATCAFHKMLEVEHATFMGDVQMLLDVHSSASSRVDTLGTA